MLASWHDSYGLDQGLVGFRVDRRRAAFLIKDTNSKSPGPVLPQAPVPGT